jgi:hypothetical protein
MMAQPEAGIFLSISVLGATTVLVFSADGMICVIRLVPSSLLIMVILLGCSDPRFYHGVDPHCLGC